MPPELLSLLTVTGTILLGAMSPGPSFILVARTAVSESRTTALCVSLGMAGGVMVFAVLALAGLHTLLTLVPWLYTTLKVGGGLYLLWLAFKMLTRSAPEIGTAASASETSLIRSCASGFLTQISNPNTALVFASIFAALLSGHIQPWMYLALPLLAFIVDFSWYALVAILLSTAGPRRIYLGCRRGIDRSSAAIMALLGIKLIFR